MSLKKRITIVLFLVIFTILLIIFSNIFESHLIQKDYQILNDQYKPFANTTNFKTINKDRYVKYYEKNSNLTYEEAVTYVNIGLDKGFYNYVKYADLSYNNKVLVNKFNKLNKSYEPKDLEKINDKYFINGNKHVNKLKKEAKEEFEKLSYDSIINGTPVYGQSAYRSYEIQSNIYYNNMKKIGKEKVEFENARPGFSEHQTGLSIDVSSTKSGNMLTFENTKSFNWIKNNAYKYGFILRYPKEKEKIHGYIYEPWHYRYVGKKIAKDMYINHSSLTYDEYYYKFIERKK